MAELSLRWEKFGLSRGLHEMLGSGELVDVTLLCQGDIVHAHKTALAACSSHFRKLFTTNPCQHPIVFMQDVKPVHLRALLSFMYTGEATVKQQDLTGFLKMAEVLKISGLAEEGEEKVDADEVPPTNTMSSDTRSIQDCSELPGPSKKQRLSTNTESSVFDFINAGQVAGEEVAASHLLSNSTDPLCSESTNSIMPVAEIKLESDEDSWEGSTSQFVAYNPPNYLPVVNNSDCSNTSSCSTSQITAPVPESPASNTTCNINMSHSMEEKKVEMENFLNSSDDGASILCYYRKYGMLNDPQQNRLAGLIIAQELSISEDKKIKRQRFQYWASAITAVFPKENEETYFVPSRNGIKGSGKLYRRYHNVREKFFHEGLLPRKVRLVEQAPRELPVALTEEVVNGLHQLRNVTNRWETTKTLWNLTFSARYNDLVKNRSDGKPIQEYINTYPPLQLDIGYELLLQDYNNLPAHMKVSESFRANFAQYQASIMQLAASRPGTEDLVYAYSCADPSNQETRDLCALLVLPSLLTAPARTHKVPGDTKRIVWKPTTSEAKDAFIVHSKTLEETLQAYTRLTNTACKWGIAVPPHISIKAEDIHCIEEVTVCIGSLLYKVNSVCEAVDLLFKAFFALNIGYPYPSEHIWLAIQKGIYNANFPNDINFTTVSSFLSRLKRN